MKTKDLFIPSQLLDQKRQQNGNMMHTLSGIKTQDNCKSTVLDNSFFTSHGWCL